MTDQPPNVPAISCKGLSVMISTSTLIDGVTLDVEPGEFLVLLGPWGPCP